MDMWMDVDTALSEVPVNIQALIDDTNFKDREESVVYNQAGMDLVWNFVTTAGVTTQTAVTPTTAGDYDWTNQGNAMYSIEIPASGGASINNDTEGYGWFSGYATGILPWRGPIIGFRAVALNNALINGGDLLDVNITHIADTSQTAGDIAALINALQNLTPAETAAAVWNALLATYNLANSFGEKFNNVETATELVTAIYEEQTSNQNVAGSFGLDIKSHSKTTITDAIKAVTDLLPDSGALTSLAQDSTVSKEATLIARSLLAAAYATIANQVTADGKLDSIETDTNRVDALLEDVGGDRYTTKALEQAPSGTGGDATEAKQDTIIANLGVVDGNVDLVLIDTTRVDGLIEDSAGDRYTAKALEEAPSGTGGDATEAKQDTILSNLAVVDSNVDLVLTDTNELQSDDIPGRLDIIDTDIAAIPTVMRGTDNANTVIPDAAGIAATPAQVNDEMVDVMSTDVHAQPGKEVLPATTSYNFILRLLYKFLRNKKDSTLTLSQLYNDDEVTVDQQSVHSGNDTLVTEEEWTIGD